MWWGDVFFFNDTATTEIYTLSLHDALPILEPEQAGAGEQGGPRRCRGPEVRVRGIRPRDRRAGRYLGQRSEEHTSELQSRQYLVCRLLLEKTNFRGALHSDRRRVQTHR